MTVADAPTTMCTEGAARTRLPDFLIVGEMRCGSTTLWELLSRHPRVFFPSEKELHFFDNRNGSWDAGVDAYAGHFASALADQLCGEATPDYLFHDDACGRIRATVPDARLLVILRDPVARAWSHYWHNVRRGRETLSFDAALAAEATRLAGGDADVRAHFSYVARGHYVESLRRYEQAFGRDALCVVFLEELTAKPGPAMRAVCAHLGLEAVAAFDDPVVPERNKARYPRWPRASAAARGARRWVSRRAAVVGRAVETVARATRPWRTYSGTPRMDEPTRQRLRAGYAASDAALAEWLGRDVPWARPAE